MDQHYKKFQQSLVRIYLSFLKPYKIYLEVKNLGVTVFLRGKFTKKDMTTLRIASELFNEFGGIIKGVQRVESWDGSNLRIIVKEDNPETIEKIMKKVYKILEKNNAIGEIIPEIVSENDDKES